MNPTRVRVVVTPDLMAHLPLGEQAPHIVNELRKFGAPVRCNNPAREIVADRGFIAVEADHERTTYTWSEREGDE